MIMKFKDCINGNKCIVTIDAGKKSKLIKLEGIESLPEAIWCIYERECSKNHTIYHEYSESERSNFFRGRCLSGDLREELIKAYSDWSYCYENGTFDPNWCDGTGLNMIRDRIEMLKAAVSELCVEAEYPECFYKELPPMVDSTYLANKEELKKTGCEYADRLEKEPFFKEIKEVAERTQELYKKMCSADKWGALRNIHWMANLPEIYREICNKDELLNLPKLKQFRKDYLSIVANLKQTLKEAIEMEKEKSIDDEEETTLEWCQMSLFDFLTI